MHFSISFEVNIQHSSPISVHYFFNFVFLSFSSCTNTENVCINENTQINQNTYMHVHAVLAIFHCMPKYNNSKYIFIYNIKACFQKDFSEFFGIWLTLHIAVLCACVFVCCVLFKIQHKYDNNMFIEDVIWIWYYIASD